MKRRQCVLGLASAFPLLSGCSGSLLNSELHPTLSVESRLTSIEAQYQLSLLRGATENHPPQIRAELTNTADSPRQYWFGSGAPLSPQSNNSPEPALQLRSSPSDNTSKTEGCWRSLSDAWLSVAYSATLQPDESISNKLDVLAAPDVNGEQYCLPKGAFTFEQSVPAFESTIGGEKGDKTGEGTLEFTLLVE